MSIRTIIEINHDYWHELQNNPEAMLKIFQSISNYPPAENDYRHYISGIRILGQRHHSETLELKVK